MDKNILRHIFFNRHQYREYFKSKHRTRLRSILLKEVEKFRNCGNFRKGFKLLVCEGCHDVRKLLFHCKGCFCTTYSVGVSGMEPAVEGRCPEGQSSRACIPLDRR
nr:transposase zinc-binding domain-containing protein [Sporolactobacillus pectinivorans]